MDESFDTATSFKFMMDIGAHMQASGLATQQEVPEEEEVPPELPPSPGLSSALRGRSPRAGKSAIKKTRSHTPQKVQGTPPQTAGAGGAGSPPKEETTPKGKRKVTFDVKPDVTIISKESSGETTPSPPQEEGQLRPGAV